jgi:hypothetical protein
MIPHTTHPRTSLPVILLAALWTLSVTSDANGTADSPLKKDPGTQFVLEHTNNPPYVPPNVWDDQHFEDPLSPGGGGAPDFTGLDPAALILWPGSTVDLVGQAPHSDWDATRVLAGAEEMGYASPAFAAGGVAPVPAPGALTLVGVGLLAVIGRRRRG